MFFFFSSIIAIERDAKRCKTLRQTVSNARASKVSVHCADFLKLNPAEYQDVKYILVDPSCSGTGNRLMKVCQKCKTKRLFLCRYYQSFGSKTKARHRCFAASFEKIEFSTISTS